MPTGPRYAECLRRDNGPEPIAQAIQRWLTQRQVETHYIEPGSPWQNAYGESFNRKFRDEYLNMEVFYNRHETEVVVDMWRTSYNDERAESYSERREPTMTKPCREDKWIRDYRAAQWKANVRHTRETVTPSPIDHSWTGRWSSEAVLRRYVQYAARLRVSPWFDFSQRIGCGTLDSVIAGIKQGDRACIELGIELIQTDEFFPFGYAYKRNAARALRRALLDRRQVAAIRTRVVTMLLVGNVPREYHDYAKLLKKVGMGEWWPYLEERVDRDNRYVMYWYDWYKRHALPEPAP